MIRFFGFMNFLLFWPSQAQPRSKAVLKHPQSRRSARNDGFEISRSVWTARG